MFHELLCSVDEHYVSRFHLLHLMIMIEQFDCTVVMFHDEHSLPVFDCDVYVIFLTMSRGGRMFPDPIGLLFY